MYTVLLTISLRHDNKLMEPFLTTSTRFIPHTRSTGVSSGVAPSFCHRLISSCLYSLSFRFIICNIKSSGSKTSVRSSYGNQYVLWDVYRNRQWIYLNFSNTRRVDNTLWNPQLIKNIFTYNYYLKDNKKLLVVITIYQIVWYMAAQALNQPP